MLTPGAAAGLNLPTDRYASAWVLTDPNQVGAADQIANGLAAFTWQVNVDSLTSGDVLNADQKTFVTIRSALLAGSLFTLLLAGVSMLVLALEQVRERRRPLAVLAAAGVPRTALAARCCGRPRFRSCWRSSSRSARVSALPRWSSG